MKKVTSIRAAVAVAVETPFVELMSFYGAVKKYNGQVKDAPAFSQRNHLAQNQAGRPHVQTEVPPSTQAVLHAARITGKMARPDKLIDGYHRMDNWIDLGRCPFENLIFIMHPIHADSECELEEKLDTLARTIDAKVAVKTNADRICAALRDAGLQAQSKAYLHGTGALTFLKKVMGGNPQAPMSKLVAEAKAGLKAHKIMDKLYLYAQKDMTGAGRKNYMTTGLALALYVQLNLPGVNEFALLNSMKRILEKLGGKASDAVSRLKLTKEETAVYERMLELAGKRKNEVKLKAVNTTAEYDIVAEELADVLTALRKATYKKAKIAV